LKKLKGVIDMKNVNRDNLPHLIKILTDGMKKHYFTIGTRLSARWWGVHLGEKCSFLGYPRFVRHPNSHIEIGPYCKFNSTKDATVLGVNHPCIISTSQEGAELIIGKSCGFTGVSIGCTKKIIIGQNVRCGNNTMIMDTDWHWTDPRTGPNAPVEIGDNVWLGINVTVTKGVTIGENTLVAAGSIVTKSLPANVIAGGIPAKVIRNI
jgi:acetyltransferase-like isoleucine patch superfamily enzyme